MMTTSRIGTFRQRVSMNMTTSATSDASIKRPESYLIDVLFGTIIDLRDTVISSIIDRNAETNVDGLLSGGPTTALEGDMKGFDDFELTTLLVIFDTNQSRSDDMQ